MILVKRKVIVNACLTGMMPTKEQTPYVPITAKEIITDALECAKLGASIVHIHPRDKSGTPTWKKEAFAQIISGIREKNPQLIISATTSGRSWNEFDKRSEVLELTGKLKPDLASLTVGSLNFMHDESISSPTMIEKLATKMMEKGIKPELEVFEPGMINKANYLIRKGIISPDVPYFNILLGSLGTAPLDPSTFAAMYNLLPTNAVWSVAGVGRFQLDANVMALAYGGNVRVGIEDDLYFDRERKVLSTNPNLVKRLVKICRDLDLEIATPEEARQILHLDSHQ
jgi:uncharacterized protein (DUF849 family)